jgi:adenylate cyclase
MVSRDALRMEELSNGLVRLNNLSTRNPVFLGGGRRIETGACEDLPPPLNLSVGQTAVVITRDLAEEPIDAVETVLAPWHKEVKPFKSLLDLGSAPTAQEITQWLEMALELQQSADDVSDLYARTAKAMVELIGLDSALVLTRSGERWNVATHFSKRDDSATNYSQTLLHMTLQKGRTLIRNREELPLTESLRETSCTVVSPIFGVQREVVGALYASRVHLIGGKERKITELEAQVVQLFAVAASTRRVRADALRVRVQFEQFFSPELVRELQNNVDLLDGREQEITILVSDLRGFSRLSEQLGPQKTCQLMRDLMDRFTQRIIEQGGVIVDYAGDGILAMWNAPIPQEDHAVRACRAALAMRDELPELNRKWQSLAGGQLDAGIGINTGVALVGNTGSSRKLKYGPHGNTVNLASRLQDTTKMLKLPVLITSSTRNKLPPEFATRRLFAARMRGIQEAVGLHELCGVNPLPAWLQKRDVYEAALEQYESGEWCKACQALVGLVEVYHGEKHVDIPTVKLLRYAWKCLELGQEMERVIDLAESS